MSEISIQERLYPTIPCFGCGGGNPGGRHLKSYLAPGGTRAELTPAAVHDNGLGEVREGGKVRVTMRATWKRFRPR